MSKQKHRRKSSKQRGKRPASLKPVGAPHGTVKTLPSAPQSEPIPQGEIIPYDEHLLERARTQWQFGDWQSLSALDARRLDHHPDRAKLALLAAAGHLQQGNGQAARHLTELALEWGCDRQLVTRVLISGAYNTLGRAATLVEQEPRSQRHFESAIAFGVPHADARLIVPARVEEQRRQLRRSHIRALLPPHRTSDAIPASDVVRSPAPHADRDLDLAERAHAAWRVGDWADLTALDKADLACHSERARLALLIAAGYQQQGDMEATQRCTDLALAWGGDPREVRTILFSGAFNLLGRAAAAALRYEWARDYFTKSLAIMQVADDSKQTHLAARVQQQIATIPGLDAAQTIAAILNPPHDPSKSDGSMQTPRERPRCPT